MSKDDEITYKDLTDEEIEEGIRMATEERNAREAAKRDLEDSKPGGVCDRCGYMFNRLEWRSLKECPLCGGRTGVEIKGGKEK